MFNVYEIRPTYDGRDCIVGERAFVVPYTFVTLKGAMAKARLLTVDPADGGDDMVHYVVRPVGMSPFFNGPHEFFRQQAQEERYGGALIDDEIPF